MFWGYFFQPSADASYVTGISAKVVLSLGDFPLKIQGIEACGYFCISNTT